MIYHADADFIAPLGVDRYKNVFLLTGAGISVASGLPTYRGPGGLWTQNDIARIVDADNLPETLPELWQLYSMRRERALQAVPNAAHVAIADLQRRPRRTEMPTLGDTSGNTPFVMLVTQNVDGLHQRAGSPEVLELHGSAFRSRCMNRRCLSLPFVDISVYEEPPRCAVCGDFLRPDIVLFGENLVKETLDQVLIGLSACDLFIAVGTSGSVAPAASFVRAAAYVGARTINVNVEASGNSSFVEEYIGPAEVVLPQLLEG